jgi:nitrate/TMAO reductase-like tetraheme cytochrome c subunit
MFIRERLVAWTRPAVFLSHNLLTRAGAVLTTSSALTLVLFWLVDLARGGDVHPYAGIVFFLILPGVFALGLLLMPAGIFLRRARLRARGELPSVYPSVDFREPLLRRAALLVGGLTVVNVALLGTASYKGVEYMDSTQFCGLACHSVMAPEHTAYLGSAHSRVSCVLCHIGPGAPWFVRSKLSGTRQLFAVSLGTYSRPIPSPVKHLRPARETCEQCHWPQKFHGDKVVVRTKFSDDEANTRLTTVMVLKIGGGSAGRGHGIHGRHLDAGSRIRYVAIDDKRQVIPRITYLDDAGRTVEYVSSDVQATPEQLARGETREMDCMDCHNRPSHTFEMPERAVDRALSEGRISAALPFVRKQSVALLRAEYHDRDTAAARIAAGLLEFYKSGHPAAYQEHRAQIEAAAQELQTIYARNVFPSMKVGWGTYANNIGHEDFLGCFRCHDDKHKSADGKTVSQDCDACHTLLAMEEQDPKIVADLGLK